MTTFDTSFKISLEESVAKLEELQTTIRAQLAALGIFEPHRPVVQTASGPMAYTGELPTNLPSLNDTELGDLLGKLSEWQNHIGYQLAVADMMNTIVSNQLEDVSSHLRIHYTVDAEGKKHTDQQRKDLMRCDRRFSEANTRSVYYDTFYTIIKSVYTAAEQSYAAVSRRITQRGQDVDRDRRGATVANIQGPPAFRRSGM